MSTSFQLPQIHSPKPENNDLSRQPRLAPHDSIMEALNMDNLDTFNNQNLEASWQSVGSAVLSRPTSSVLSSDETDDETTNLPLTSAPYASIQLNDDDRTIEIDMNPKITQRYTTTTGSAFIMPDIIEKDSLLLEHDNNKILIIGHRKSMFFKSFAQKHRSRFTLNSNDSYNIILVIFDGLIKIGNIIQFIKKSHLNSNEKPVIPVFRNINWEVIEQILKLYKIDKLLCSPIHYDNKLQVHGLLENLINDYILPDKSYLNDYQTSQSDRVENHRSIYFLENDSFSPIDSTVNYRSISQNSIIVKHHILNNSIQSIQSSSSKYSSLSDSSQVLKKYSPSKKLQSRESKRKKYYLLSFSLTLGVGIGVASAYALSLFNSNAKNSIAMNSNYPVTLEDFFASYPNDPWFDNPLKNAWDVILKCTKATGGAIKENAIDLKDTTVSCSSFIVNEIGLAVKNISSVCGYWMNSLSSRNFYTSSLMWSF